MSACNCVYFPEAAEERASLSNVPPNYSEPMCVPEFADRYSMLQGKHYLLYKTTTI